MMGVEIAAQQFIVRRARPASVVLAPGALSPAHRLTGLYGQIRRTEAVEVDFGQSFEGKKVTSRVSARPFPTSLRFRSPQGGAGLTACAIRRRFRRRRPGLSQGRSVRGKIT